MIDGRLDKFEMLNQCLTGRKCSGTCQSLLIHCSLRILLMAADIEDVFIKCARTRVGSAWKSKDSWKHGRSHQILVP